jgi:sec-independent protein translocase protein TatB
MIELGISKLALIGAVALVVIGPEKLPRVARTVGTLLGRAQRYVADVKRSIELEELRKMKESVESAARDVESTIRTGADDFEKSWQEATAGLDVDGGTGTVTDSYESAPGLQPLGSQEVPPSYRPPKKNWRLKRSAVPQWYKARHGVRTRAQSGAARVARYRPKSLSMPR